MRPIRASCFCVNGAHQAPIDFEANSIEGNRQLLSGIDLNVGKGNITAANEELYRAKTAHEGLLPADHPEAWEKLAQPTDDLRAVDRTPYAAMGVR